MDAEINELERKITRLTRKRLRIALRDVGRHALEAGVAIPKSELVLEELQAVERQLAREIAPESEGPAERIRGLNRRRTELYVELGKLVMEDNPDRHLHPKISEAAAEVRAVKKHIANAKSLLERKRALARNENAPHSGSPRFVATPKPAVAGPRRPSGVGEFQLPVPPPMQAVPPPPPFEPKLAFSPPIMVLIIIAFFAVVILLAWIAL